MFITNKNFRKSNFNLISLHENEFNHKRFNEEIYELFEYCAFYNFEYYKPFYIHLLDHTGHVAYSVTLLLNNYEVDTDIHKKNDLIFLFNPEIDIDILTGKSLLKYDHELIKLCYGELIDYMIYNKFYLEIEKNEGYIYLYISTEKIFKVDIIESNNLLDEKWDLYYKSDL